MTSTTRRLASAFLLALAAAVQAQREARVSEEEVGGADASRSVTAITLDDALALAARDNADLLATRVDADVSRAERAAARAALLPRLDLSTSLGRNFVGASDVRTLSLGGVTFPVAGGPASDTSAYSLALQLSQTLFDWQRFSAIRQTVFGARAASSKLDEAAFTVAFTVTQRFYDLVKQERSLAVLEKTARRSQGLVERADALFSAGRAPRSDTYAVRANLATDRIAVEAQRARVVKAQAALARALGRSDGDPLEAIAPASLDSPRLLSGEPPPLKVLLARARKRRPALVAAAEQVGAARAGARGARAGYLPALSAQATYSRSGETLAGRDGTYGDPGRAYSATAQLVLSWNLFEGFGTDAQVARAEGTLANARAAAQSAGDAVAEEVTSARAAIVSLTREVALAQGGLATARDALRLATERFEAGLASQLEERDASLKLSQAELTLLETRVDHAVALADLARAVGGAL